uniref:Uncharacterized protein n=1 Tax=Chaetoceros debilis TaxID=122233 RepID=A0A7S3QJI5_9STRA|mmetsp:Transcript_27259/g.40271  ORF Transcript_27259/g.40271 Transcript_27259/m.40271 type:complete len:394 (+) Transcript_27259:13-1194(+)
MGRLSPSLFRRNVNSTLNILVLCTASAITTVGAVNVGKSKNEESRTQPRSSNTRSPDNGVKYQQYSSHLQDPSLYAKPSLRQRLMNQVLQGRHNLPTPRILTPQDNLFQTRPMRKGLQQRQADERKLQGIQATLIQCARANDRPCVESNMQVVNELLYGKGVSMQAREEFLVKYGCTPYSKDILDRILALSFVKSSRNGNTHHRGIIDIGAGNGQWSRALSDRAKELFENENVGEHQKNHNQKQQRIVDIVAYDDGSEIPLNTKIYHDLTQPARDYFYDVENRGGVEAVGLLKNRGRVLLLVYPPPGPMALDVVKNYVRFPENDLVVFVGEGVGGANGNEELFNYFKEGSREVGEWALLECMDVPNVEGGGKGFEKVFIFKRLQKNVDHLNAS